jgi:hypothetical protein
LRESFAVGSGRARFDSFTLRLDLLYFSTFWELR